MPAPDPHKEETWHKWYRHTSEDGTRELGYERDAKHLILGHDHWHLLDALGIKPGERIISIGSGFGFLAEDWIERGFGPIACVDTSAWIHANKKDNARLPILNENIQSIPARLRIRSALGLSVNQKAEWVITEDVLSSIEDNEVAPLVSACRKLGERVVHWVTPAYGPDGGPSPGQVGMGNFKTCEAWKAIVAPDLVVWRGVTKVF